MPLIQLDQTTLHYERAGESGPCVLLVPGVGVLGAGWRPQIDGLSRDHRLAWLDLRGIGRSVPLRGPVTIREMAADCVEVLNRLGWEGVHLVGHSMGGVIVQEVARLIRARVQSLTLLATFRRGRDAINLSPSLMWTRLRGSIGSERTRWLRFSETLFPASYRAARGDDAVIEMLRSAFCPDFLKSPPILFMQIAALVRHTGGDMSVLREIPALIATGAMDRVALTVHSQELARHLPHANLVRFPEAGHNVNMQHPDEVNQLIREHIAAAQELPFPAVPQVPADPGSRR